MLSRSLLFCSVELLIQGAPEHDDSVSRAGKRKLQLVKFIIYSLGIFELM